MPNNNTTIPSDSTIRFMQELIRIVTRTKEKTEGCILALKLRMTALVIVGVVGLVSLELMYFKQIIDLETVTVLTAALIIAACFIWTKLHEESIRVKVLYRDLLIGLNEGFAITTKMESDFFNGIPIYLKVGRTSQLIIADFERANQIRNLGRENDV